MSDAQVAEVLGDIALVLALSILSGLAARRCGQPKVVGQILAGIVLGPTVLGRLPGHLDTRLFPVPVLSVLSVLSQVAVVLFMFSVGHELARAPRPASRRAPLLVAAGALLIPLAMGMGAATAFRPLFAAVGQSAPTRPFVLFMGVAVSVTALPVLAAIVRERNIAGTVAGLTATAAAGVMDVAAWLVLALALAGTTSRSGRPWLLTVLLTAGLVAVLLFVVRPALRWWMSRRWFVLSAQLPVAFVLALGTAWATASLGLHPVFGGFLAGLAMPSPDGAADADVLRAMDEAGSVLLPLFFVVTGLSVNIGALRGPAFAILGIVCFVALAGKLVPGYLGARIGGLGPPDAASVAALVSTRGLTELIALNVGLSAGIIGPQLFTVLVVMALFTTAVTAPLLSLLGPSSGRPGGGRPFRPQADAPRPAPEQYKDHGRLATQQSALGGGPDPGRRDDGHDSGARPGAAPVDELRAATLDPPESHFLPVLRQHRRPVRGRYRDHFDRAGGGGSPRTLDPLASGDRRGLLRRRPDHLAGRGTARQRPGGELDDALHPERLEDLARPVGVRSRGPLRADAGRLHRSGGGRAATRPRRQPGWTARMRTVTVPERALDGAFGDRRSVGRVELSEPRGGTAMARTEQEILTELASIIDEVTGIPASEITPDKSFKDDLELDSLSMVEIAVVALDRLGVKIPDDALRSMVTVQDVIGYVQVATPVA